MNWDKGCKLYEVKDEVKEIQALGDLYYVAWSWIEWLRGIGHRGSWNFNHGRSKEKTVMNGGREWEEVVVVTKWG